MQWFHENLPRQTLPSWEACEQHLVNSFENLGIDHKVKDVTRILRVLHTVNQKSGNVVKVLWTNNSNNAVVSYKFNDLCAAILPFTQEQIKNFRANAKKLNRIQKSAVVHFNSATGFSLRTQNWVRLMDLQALNL